MGWNEEKELSWLKIEGGKRYGSHGLDLPYLNQLAEFHPAIVGCIY